MKKCFVKVFKKRPRENDGFTFTEFLVTSLLTITIFASIAYSGHAGIKAWSVSTNRVDGMAKARMAIYEISRELKYSNPNTIVILACGAECFGEKINYKVPVADKSPIECTIYTQTGEVKFGAVVGTQGRQDCFYQIKIVPDIATPNLKRLFRETYCDPDLGYCGNGVCGSGEDVVSCPADCIPVICS